MHVISFNPSFQEWQALFTIAPFKGTVSGISNEPHAQTHTPNPLVNVNSTVCCTGYAYRVSALFTQCPGDTVETGTGKVDPAARAEDNGCILRTLCLIKYELNIFFILTFYFHFWFNISCF